MSIISVNFSLYRLLLLQDHLLKGVSAANIKEQEKQRYQPRGLAHPNNRDPYRFRVKIEEVPSYQEESSDVSLVYNPFDNPVIIEEEPQLRQPAIMSTEDSLTQLMRMMLEDRKIEKEEWEKKEKLDKTE